MLPPSNTQEFVPIEAPGHAARLIRQLDVALVGGLMMATIHASWLLLVADGWAQATIHFVLWVHSIKSTPTIEPFESARTVALEGLVTASGALAGGFLAFVGIWRMPSSMECLLHIG